MEATNISRMLQRLVAAGILSLFAVLAGCSENTTGPAPTDTNPPGTNATVDISDPVSEEEANSVRNNAQRNAADTIIISIDEAITRAIQESGGGELLGVTLDYDRDELNYECVVRNSGKAYLIVIDPRNGTVKKKEQIENFYYPEIIIIRPIVVKIKQAKEQAKKFTKGDVIECNLENVDGRITYIVIILSPERRYVTLYIDAETGRERKLEDNGRCKEEKKKNKRSRGHYRYGKGYGYGHHHHCYCNCDTNGNGGDTTKVPSGIISVDSVKTIINATLDSVVINEIKLNVENDSTARYNIKISRDSNRYEIVLDAFKGSLISISQTAGDLTNAEYHPVITKDSATSDTLVALSVARTAALAQFAGTVTMWTLDYDKTEAKWIYTFEVQPAGTGNRKQVVVDATTGAFIRIK